MDDPISLAITCVLTAHMEAHLGEAQLYDSPFWLVQFSRAQRATRRWSTSDLDRLGLPLPQRVLDEVCTVSVATGTSRTVQILALGLLERMFPASSRDFGDPISSPGAQLTAASWSTIWLFCVHFAAKTHYDQRCLLVDLTYHEGLTANLAMDDLKELEMRMLSSALFFSVHQHPSDFEATVSELVEFARLVPPPDEVHARTRGLLARREASMHSGSASYEACASVVRREMLADLIHSEAYEAKLRRIRRVRREQVVRYARLEGRYWPCCRGL